MSKKKKDDKPLSDVERKLTTGQMELFNAHYFEPPPPIKGDQKSGQHPMFSLSTKRADKKERTIEVPGGSPITVFPGHHGMCNMDDKKVLVYIVSQMAEGQKRGHSLSKTSNQPIEWVQISTADLQKTIMPESDAASFRKTLVNRLRRLKGTQYEVDFEVGEERFTGNLSFLHDFVLPQRLKGFHGKLFVMVPPWVVKLVQSWGVLTYHRGYYEIESPLQRRLYEIARGYCGNKEEQRMALAIVKEKCGSQAADLWKFRQEFRALLDEDGVCDLLDYVMYFEEAKDQVRFVRNSEFLERMADKELEDDED